MRTQFIAILCFSLVTTAISCSHQPSKIHSKEPQSDANGQLEESNDDSYAAADASPQFDNAASDDLMIIDEMGQEYSDEPNSVTSTLTDNLPPGIFSQQRTRILHYNANLTLSKSEIDKISRIAAIIKKLDGKILEQSKSHLVADVPSNKLETTLDQLGKNFKVTSRELNIVDLTSTLPDLKERRRAITGLISKFQELLKSPSTKNKDLITEKISQLRRVLAQIDEKLAIKSEMVAYSRVTIGFDASEIAADQSTLLDHYFSWLYNIGELRKIISDTDVKALAVKTPKGFVSVEKTPQVNAYASPNNIRLQAFSRPNNPQGNSKFWQVKTQKIWSELGATAKTSSVGKFHIVTIESKDKDSEPVILVAFRSRGKTIDVIMAKAPSKSSFKDYQSKILDVISTAGGKA